ncbi:hypothetical protein JW865_09420 [Candidatus Bathyarchaeota archaeon]|nr:hypothetical protein [Candidatus Bathyarchaeota archaeon]
MPSTGLLDLYNKMYDTRLYTKSFEDFSNQYGTEESMSAIYDILSSKTLNGKKLVTVDKKTFRNAYYPQLKKNEDSISGSKEMGTTQESSSAFAESNIGKQLSKPFLESTSKSTPVQGQGSSLTYVESNVSQKIPEISNIQENPEQLPELSTEDQKIKTDLSGLVPIKDLLGNPENKSPFTQDDIDNLISVSHKLNPLTPQESAKVRSEYQAEQDKLYHGKYNMTRSEYILAGMNNSLIIKGLFYTQDLVGVATDPDRDKNKSIFTSALEIYQKDQKAIEEYMYTYTPSLVDKTANFVLGMAIDMPLFGALGKVGVYGGKLLTKGGSFVSNSLIKKGVTEAVAEQVTTNAMKRLVPKLIEGASSGGTALGGYDFLLETERQLADGASFKDIEWKESLREGGEGAVLGSSISLLGFGSKLLENAVSKNATTKIGQLSSKAGIKTGEFVAENAVFVYGSAAMSKDQSIKDVTLGDLGESMVMLGALKLSNKFNSGSNRIPKSTSFKKGKANTGVYRVDFTSDDLTSVSKSTGREIKEVTDITAPELENITKDPNVSIITKQKALWALEGLRPEVDKIPVDVRTETKDGITEVSYLNKTGDVIHKKAFTDKVEADKEAIQVLENIKDNLNREKSGVLKPGEIIEVSNELEGTGFDMDSFRQSFEKPVEKRTSEDRKVISKYNNAVRDYKIKKFREKTGAEQLVDFKLKNETFETLDDISRNVPIINDRLNSASNDLYNEYKRLDKSRDSDTRTNTHKEISDAMEFLGKEIANLQNQIEIQKGKGRFFNLKSRGNEAAKTEKETKSVEEVKPAEKKPIEDVISKPLDTKDEAHIAELEKVRNEAMNPEVKPVEEVTQTKSKGLEDLGIDKYEPEKVSTEKTSEKKLGKLLQSDYGNISKKHDIKYDGESVGYVDTFENDNSATIANIRIEKGQGLGMGKDTLRDLNKQFSKEGKVLKSSDNQSVDAKRVWESLVKSNEAVKIGDTKYEMKPIETVTKDITESRVENRIEKPTDNATENGETPKETGDETVRDNRKQSGQEADLRYNEKTELETRTREERLAEANSQEELDLLMSEGLYSINDKEFVEKRDLAYKNGWETKADVLNERTKKVNELIENEGRDKPKAESIFPAIFEFMNATPSDTRKFINKYFSRSRNAPKGVLDEFTKKRGRVAKTTNEIKYIMNDLYKQADSLVKDSERRAAMKGEIMKAMESIGTTSKSRSDALINIDPSLHLNILAAREKIDVLSDQLKERGILNSETADKNTGLYVSRTYKKYTDKNWTWDKIDNSLKEAAARVIEKYFPKATSEEVMGMLKSMLLKDGIKNLVTSSPLGNSNRSQLKARSQFLTDNPEIREFLGENRDPKYAITSSVVRMSEMLETHKMLEAITDNMLKQGLLSKGIDGTKNHTAKIGTGKAFKIYQDENGVTISENKNSKYNPINQYYTKPEIAEAFNEFFERDTSLGVGGKIWTSAVIGAKISKTVLSSKSIVRNFLSNPINVLANGNINIHKVIAEVVSRSKTKEGRRELLNELNEQSILGDNMETGALLHNMSDLNIRMDGLEKAKSLPKKSLEIMFKAYELGDDFWKVTRYFSEKATYKKVYEKTMSKDAAETKARETASKIVHDSMAFYSQAPRLVQMMRKFPATGTFVTFPFMTTVNAFNTLKQATIEMRSSETFGIGLKRASAFLATTSALSLIAAKMNNDEGKSIKDMEDLRRFLPKYFRNDIIGLKSTGKNGIYTYQDLSYMDYYNAVTGPTRYLTRRWYSQGDLTTEDFKRSALIFTEPYTSKDIIYKMANDLWNNMDSETHREIYRESDDDKYKKITNHVWKAFEPGTMTDIKRVLDVKRSEGDWKPILRGMFTGSQNRELNIEKSMSFYIINELQNNIKSARGIYYDEKRRKSATKGEILDAKNKSERAINNYILDMHETIKAAIRQGLPEGKIKEIISKTSLNKEISRSIVLGTEISIDKDGFIVEKIRN